MSEFLSQAFGLLLGGGLLLWVGKTMLEKAIQTKLEMESDKISLVRHRDLDHKVSQVHELYGPLYGLLKTNRKIYDLWMAGELGEINLKVKQLFKANNEMANKLIIEHAHLVEESPMPESFIRYATSSQVWSMYCADTEDGALPERLSNHPDVRWCQEFEDYIFTSYERLSKELADLYALYEIK